MAYSPLLLNFIVPRASGTHCIVRMESGEPKRVVRIWAHVHHATVATRALFLNFFRDLALPLFQLFLNFLRD